MKFALRQRAGKFGQIRGPGLCKWSDQHITVRFRTPGTGESVGVQAKMVWSIR